MALLPGMLFTAVFVQIAIESTAELIGVGGFGSPELLVTVAAVALFFVVVVMFAGTCVWVFASFPGL